MESDNSAKSHSLADGRKPYEFATKYPPEAWKYIWWEAAYLAAVLLLSMFLVALMVAPIISLQSNFYHDFLISFLGEPKNTLFLYLVVVKFGILGGTLFDIKWLVHTVAKVCGIETGCFGDYSHRSPLRSRPYSLL